jgi:hypothetical protein
MGIILMNAQYKNIFSLTPELLPQLQSKRK